MFASVNTALTPLAVLACPVGMVVMMWMMGRAHNTANADTGHLPSATAAEQGQPALLEVLREEQRRLTAEIDRLEAEREANGAGFAR